MEPQTVKTESQPSPEEPKSEGKQLKIENISNGTVMFVCALTANGEDVESISRKLRVLSKEKETLTALNVHDTHMITCIFNNWRNNEQVKKV